MNFQTSTEILDLSTMTWKHLTDSPVGRAVHGGKSIVYGGKVLVYAGELQNGDDSDAVREFDPVTEKWTNPAWGALPFKARRHVALDVTHADLGC